MLLSSLNRLHKPRTSIIFEFDVDRAITFGLAGYVLESLLRRNPFFSASRMFVPIYSIGSAIRDPIAFFLFVIIGENVAFRICDKHAKFYYPSFGRVGYSNCFVALFFTITMLLVGDLVATRQKELLVISSVINTFARTALLGGPL